MIERSLRPQISSYLQTFPVVALLGARQTGKTTLAKALISHTKTSAKESVYLDLELHSDLMKLSDPELYLEQYSDRLVIIDEVQRKPDLFPLLRALVDKKRRSGRFLLLGSASPELVQKTSESLAGRIGFLELGPFSFKEICGRFSLKTHWWRGGYPPALLASSDQGCRQWTEAFIRTYLERDIPQFGIRVPALEMRRLWMLLSHSQGNIVNFSDFGRSLGYSVPTVKYHLAILENTFQVFLLQPWQITARKRLVKSPKLYVCDSGILHTLLSIKDFDELQAHPALGASFEGYVIEQIRLNKPQNIDISFYRSHAGAEIDLVLERAGKAKALVEIKYSASPALSRGFFEGKADLGDAPAWVIYPGTEIFPVKKDCIACPLQHFINQILPGLE